MDLTPDTLDRACALMKAIRTSDYHVGGCYSLVFSISAVEFHLTFGLPDDLVLLIPAPTESLPNTQFIFKCNAIAFHPRASPQQYMICFHEVQGLVKTPKLLVAGDIDGVRAFRFYSIPGVETEGELDFPPQL